MRPLGLCCACVEQAQTTFGLEAGHVRKRALKGLHKKWWAMLRRLVSLWGVSLSLGCRAKGPCAAGLRPAFDKLQRNCPSLCKARLLRP